MAPWCRVDPGSRSSPSAQAGVDRPGLFSPTCSPTSAEMATCDEMTVPVRAAERHGDGPGDAPGRPHRSGTGGDVRWRCQLAVQVAVTPAPEPVPWKPKLADWPAPRAPL